MKKVVIVVEGGIAQVERAPDDVDVETHDLDIDHCDVCQTNDIRYVCFQCVRFFCARHRPGQCECGGEIGTTRY